MIRRDGAGSPWVMRLHGRAGGPARRLRLFCLPYAGGSASIFRAWPAALGDAVDVCPIQLPGRGNRLHEEPFTRMDDLLSALVEALLPLLDLPYAFFGHSLGALVGFELARRLRARVGTQPVLQLVSACRAPQVPARETPIHELPDHRFLARMGEVDGIPAEVLESAELMELLLPLLRADIELAETYRWRPDAPPLGCPISALGSEEDRFVTRDDVEAWRVHTTGAFAARFLPGGHFFIHAAEGALLDAVRADLRPHSARHSAA
jgi:medium-chain acyl-[acyl-carrier-protein] hydrolase